MKKLNEIFWTRIGNNVAVSELSLPVFRIFTGLWILIFHFESYAWLGQLPDYLMQEPVLSTSNLLRSYPDPFFMMMIDAVRLLSVIFLLFGIRARYAGMLFFFLSIYAKSVQYTLGSIEHDFLLYLLLFVMSFSNWGSQLALVPDRVREGFSNRTLMAIFALCLCWGMFTAGYLKAFIWIDFDTSTNGCMRWLTEGYYSIERNHFLASYMFKVDWKYLEVLDYLAVVFELTPLLFLWINRKAWLTWILIAVVFHFVNILFMNINFMTHLLVYAVFIDWGALANWILRLMDSYKWWVFSMIGVIICCRFIDIFYGKMYFDLLFYFSNDYYYMHLIVGLIIWSLLAYRLVVELRRKRMV